MKFLKLQESANIILVDKEIDKKKVLSEAKEGKKVKLRARIEAIHETVTKNDIMYSADRLRGDSSLVSEGKIRPSGQYSWTRPYEKPMLINHDSNTKPLGRIVEAQYRDKTSGGSPGIEVLVELSDPEAIKMVLDGRYLTVSIGADTDALHCSICNSNVFEEEFCGHWKGETYEGVKCHYKVGNLWFSELSFVNKPADENARVVGFDKITEGEESKNEFYILDDERRAFVLLEVVEENSDGEEADNMKTKMSEFTPEELAALTPEQLAELEDDLDSGTKEGDNEPGTSEGDNDPGKQPTINVTESEEYVALQEQLSALQESHNGLLETLLDVVRNAGLINENSEPAGNDDPSAEVVEMQEKVSSLEAENVTLQEEVSNLTGKMIEYQSKIRDTMVEKIIALKLNAGKISEDQIEEETSAYKERSEESLTDTLADLTRESKASTQRPRKTVNSPGAVDNSGKGIIDEGTEDQKQIKKLQPTDVFRGLLSGKKQL